MAAERDSLLKVTQELAQLWRSTEVVDESLVDFYVSLMVRAQILRGTYPMAIAGMMCQAVAESGPNGARFIEEVVDLAHANMALAKMKTVDETGAAEYIRLLRSQGEEAGLMHGKHRHVEVNQIVALIEASKRAHVVLGVDSSAMIVQQGSRPLLPDSIRQRIYASLPMTDVVFVASGPASDEYFTSLMKRLAPTVYFCSEEYPLNVLEERRRRADSVGAKLEVLPHISSLGHTTKYEELLMRTEKEWSILLGRQG